MRDQLQQKVARVRQNIAAACACAGRDPASVCLVAVTKSVDTAAIRLLLSAGVNEIGENRVQQLVARAQEVGAEPAPWTEPEQRPASPAAAPRWHMVGHLQRNKVKALLPHARLIHSLDSIRLADEIESVAARLDVTVDAFIEINVSGEAQKCGVAPGDLEALIAGVRKCGRIRLRGLMTMPPFDPDPEHARPHFARLRELLRRLQETGAVGPEFRHLSMGMSLDYPVAVEEGATFVRVGTTLFEGLLPDSACEAE